MSILKISVLTVSSFTLWLAPPFVLSKKIPLHNFTTGLALLGSFACCFEVRRVAVKLSQVEKFEAMKEAAINADVADELATEIYVSEQQRRIEAEQILNGGNQLSEDVERLERALALTPSKNTPSSEEPSKQLVKTEVEPEPEPEKNDDAERQEQIMQLRARGYSKAKIILELWGVNKGGSAKYKAAEAEYKRLIGDAEDK